MQLFQRSHWLLGHAANSPTFEFGYAMRRAPRYAEWEHELQLLETESLLA